MSIESSCPNCGQWYTLPERLAGKHVKCKQCAEVFQLPDVQSEPVSARKPIADEDEAPPDLYGLADEDHGEPLPTLPPRAGASFEASEPEAKPKKKRKTRKSDSAGVGHPLKWLAGGLAGGAIGAMIWAAIGYSIDYEIGWIAWGVGLLAGLGVRAGAKDDVGVAPGLVAVVAAVLGILLGKFVVVTLIVQGMGAGGPVEDTQFLVVRDMADEIAYEWEEQGRPLNWPPGMSVDVAYEREDYPADLWAEAELRWTSLPPEQQQDLIRQYQENLAMIPGALIGFVFVASLFSPWNLLWFGLASVTAFRVGSGASN